MTARKKVWIGLFVVGGIVLFAVGLFLIGSREQLFSQHFHVYTDMSNMQTLQTGAMVRVAGDDAGQVTAIRIPKNPSEKFRLTLEVDEKFHALVREDSVTSVETAGMVGSKYVNIAQGKSDSPEAPPGATLPSKESSGMSELMAQGNKIANEVEGAIRNLQSEADQTLSSFTDTAKHVDQLIVSNRGNVQQIASNAAQLTSDARKITSGIMQGQGAAGKLLTDKTVAANLETTIAQAKDISVNVDSASQKANTMIDKIDQNDLPDVHRTLQNTSDMTAQMNQAVGTFLAKGNHNEDTAVALNNAVHGTQQAVTNLSDDTEAIKHNFFLRGFFHRRGYFNLSDLTPVKYQKTEFVKKPRVRVWVPAAGLFTAGPDGKLQLTETGRNILNQSMSDLVPFLPNDPVVIEGYAVQGMPDQRYLVSRQRAELAAQYLEPEFHMKSNLVGIMPLGDRPPVTTGKSSWDGLCLILVVSR